MSNSIETAIAIAFLGTIGIAIAKAIFQLLLLVLLRQSQNYCSYPPFSAERFLPLKLSYKGTKRTYVAYNS